jgi:hypothetical protein
MKMNWVKLKAAIASVTKDIRAMKALQRESHQPRWGFGGNDEGALRGLKWEATRLSCIAAHTRGHLHMRKWGKRVWTAEEQAKFIGKGMEVFQTIDSQPTVVAV